MEQESKQYLDKVACIAQANMAFHQQTPQFERSPDEAGAAILMSAFLEMYDHWQNNEPGLAAPSDRIYFAANSCVQIRKELELEPRHNWTDEEEGMFQLMTAFMFLFKHMYIAKN
jgi:hypothetical protein